jgi:TIR domain
MKVLISWSGPQSQYIARTLQTWLVRVIQHLDPWMSELDIGAGQRWANELWKELQDVHFGVVCLTAENLQAPWLHFEAGALAKAVNQRVCPYLYEIQPGDVQGPLSHFQMKQVDKQGTRALLHSINEASNLANEKGLRPDYLDNAFETWWSKLEAELKSVPPIIIPETRSPSDIAWTQWIEYTNLQRSLGKLMEDPDVRAHIPDIEQVKNEKKSFTFR